MGRRVIDIMGMLWWREMNKEELIEKARKAILRGEDGFDEWYIYSAKIDLDVKIEESALRRVWEITRKGILESFGYVVVDINTTETERGLHSMINYLCKMKLSDEYKNFLQLLLGDDIIRFKINQRRIERGISFEKANILFSKVLHRYPHEESRLKLALERIVGELK